MGVSRFGAYSTQLNIDHRYAFPFQPTGALRRVRAIWSQVLTAYYGLIELGNLQAQDTVLIHSAAGGVGIWANRIVKLMTALP